ncbi:hypothetical protein F5884DRAFT_897129 [Xylogone sp. PMI_703]|nr:hypothetical protein F5884DRAFT_897129 [Xylogone sp. PMI_703]
MANMSLRLQILLLFCATASSLRPALFPRQFVPCGVECEDGWCCADFEVCVATPGNTDTGGWGCVFQGITNDDGSPITDIPFNPSADAAFASSLNNLIASITAEFSITSLPPITVTSSTTSSSELQEVTTTSRASNPASPTTTSSTTTIPPQPSSSPAAQSQPSSSPEISSASPASESSVVISSLSPSSSSSSSPAPLSSSSETSTTSITTTKTNSTPTVPTQPPVSSSTPFVSGATAVFTMNWSYTVFMTFLVGIVMMAYSI